MSTTILSFMLHIYCQISYMIFYFHYFGYVGELACKVYHVTLGFFLYDLCQTKHSKLQNSSLDNLGTALLQKIDLNPEILLYDYMVVICYRQFFLFQFDPLGIMHLFSNIIQYCVKYPYILMSK